MKSFSRLREENGKFAVTSKKSFKPSIDVSEYTADVIEWAYNNVWGKGHLKSSGRDKSTKFRDSILGKFGEFALYKHLVKIGYDLPSPDLTVMGYGEWDDGDLFLEGKKISVKSTNFFSDLLLLKKEEWDQEGGYLYGRDGIDRSYKAFFLCRMKPNLDDILPIEGDDDPGIDHLNQCLEHVNFRMDIPGYITIEDFKKIIQNNMFIPAGGKIGKKGFDLPLYYCQTGDLRDLDSIPNKKK